MRQATGAESCGLGVEIPDTQAVLLCLITALIREQVPLRLLAMQSTLSSIVVYYESLKRELKTKTTYGYRCDERLKTNVKESTLLGSQTPVSEMGEYTSVML